MRVEALAVLLLTAGFAGCVGDTGSPEAGPASTNESTDPSTDQPSPETSSDENQTDSRASGNTTAANRSSEPSGPSPGTVLAEGQIRAGSFTTNVLSTASGTDCRVQEVDSFCFQDPPTGVTVQTRTNTSSPQYNIDVYFHNNTDGYLGGCNTGSGTIGGDAGDETNCTIPSEADWGTVDATFGVDLSVKLVVQAAAEP